MISREEKSKPIVDKMEKEIRKNHIKRLKTESCAPEEGVFFMDIVSNLERISDHAENIAQYVLDENEKNVTA